MAEIRLKGVIVAAVLPFAPSGKIDWKSFERLLDYCTKPDEVSSVFVNGHAGEGAALSNAERTEVITFARARIGSSHYLTAGIIANSTADALQQAKDAAHSGADGVVLFPMPQFAGGGANSFKVVSAYINAIVDGAGLPVSIFQYPLVSGLGYSTDVLIALAGIPGVEAIKEGSNSFKDYEDHWRLIKETAPHVAVLPSNFNWFLAQTAVGADGILSGLASLTPHYLADLWNASQAGTLFDMRRASDVLYPIVRAIYGFPPIMDMHTRIKACLYHLGIIDSAFPRLPLLPLEDDTVSRLAEIVDRAGLERFLEG